MSINILFFVINISIFLLITEHQNLTKNNDILNGTDAERYFTVETARGYIVINREYIST